MSYVLGRAAQSRRRHRLTAVVLSVLLTAGALVTAPAVGAVEPGNHDGTVVAERPVSWTPHALDGYIEAFAEVGDRIVVGGNFQQIRTANDETPITKPYMFVFERGTGNLTSFDIDINGQVMSLVPSGDGETVFVGGGFSSINGQTVRSLAKINIITGEVVTAFNPPAFNGRVHDLQLRNGTLYVSGRFTKVANKPHTLFAAVDPTTGALDADVKLEFAEPRRNGALSILASDVTPDGSKLVAIGNFTKVNGLSRYQIAQIDLTTNPPSVADWHTGQYGDGCSNSFQSYMRDVEYSQDGSFFVVGTTGAYNRTYLCDTAARWETETTGSNLMPTWVNYTGGDTLTAVAVGDSVVYLGGHQRWANNPYAADRVGAGAVERPGLGAVDPRSGATLSWNPGRTRGYGVYGFLLTDAGLWIGSDTDRIYHYTYKGRMAFLPLAGGTTLPTEWTGTLPGQTVSVNGSVEQICVRTGLFGIGCREWEDVKTEEVTTRDFTGTAVTTSSTESSTTDWHDNRGAFMVDGVLYTGWANGTFKRQSYDGSNFGAVENIPLALIPDNSASLNRFATEDLSSITGMFYDNESGKLFFTREGSNVLSYRTFTPESDIVGAERYDSSNSAGGVSWSGVRSMFLADGYLYTGDTSGRLYRRSWDSVAGLPTGTATLVSGPTVDGQNWSARDTFVFAEADWQEPNVLPVANATASCTDATCLFDASGSTDVDGSIVSYAWDFGDGTSPGTGVLASHVYATSGTFTVTLTVTDDRGGVSTTQIEVEADVPNMAPSAAFSHQCEGFECTFDASASQDPDGTIVAHDWDFGDDTSGQDAVTSHTYTEAGTYTVVLTVTDDRGATATRTTDVNVIDPDATASVDFVGATAADTNSRSLNIEIPQIPNGSTLLLFATYAKDSVSVTSPDGWTLVDSDTNATTSTGTYLWTRTANAADSGDIVTVGASATVKVSGAMVAYTGVDAIRDQVLDFDTVSHAERTTPVVTVPAAGSRLVSYWADRSSATTGWALPGAVSERIQSVGPGGGHIAAAVGDSGPLAPGSAGGHTAVADSVTRRANTWSVVLSPAATGPNMPPTAAFDQSCTNLACTFDASASIDVDGSIESYEWNFGDGSTAEGKVVNHTFAGEGNYDVTLVVTDDQGATSTTQTSVSITVTATVPAFRGASEFDSNTMTARVDMPQAVEVGDTLVLIASVNSNTPTITGPTGWTLLGGENNSSTGMQSYAWTRTATADDLGSIVTIGATSYAKISAHLLAYSDADGVGDSAVFFDSVNHAERSTPMVEVANPGSVLISFWSDKNGGPNGWTIPGNVVGRTATIGSGGGMLTANSAETSSLVPGPVGDKVAVADATTRRAAMWSIVVEAKSD